MLKTIIFVEVLILGVVLGHILMPRVVTQTITQVVATPGDITECVSKYGTFTEKQQYDVRYGEYRVNAVCNYPSHTTDYSI